MNLKRVQDAKIWISAVLASVATGLGTWVAGTITNSPLWLKLLVTAVFPVVSTLIVDSSFNLLQKTRLGRRLLAGSVWIEGCWYIYTLNAPNDPHPVVPGLMYIRFGPTDDDLSVVVYRTTEADQQIIVTASESTLATYRDTDRQLMNVCMQRYQQQEEKALGVGTFLYESVKDYPTRYEGWMIRISEGIYRSQFAERIPQSTISRNRKEFGDDWILRTLEQYQTRKLVPLQATRQVEAGT
jgi:hypothetical protein